MKFKLKLSADPENFTALETALILATAGSMLENCRKLDVDPRNVVTTLGLVREDATHQNMTISFEDDS